MAKSGKTRKNCPSSTDKVKSGDAWARKFSSFEKAGGIGGDPMAGGKPKVGGVVTGLPTES